MAVSYETVRRTLKKKNRASKLLQGCVARFFPLRGKGRDLVALRCQLVARTHSHPTPNVSRASAWVAQETQSAPAAGGPLWSGYWQQRSILDPRWLGGG